MRPSDSQPHEVQRRLSYLRRRYAFWSTEALAARAAVLVLVVALVAFALTPWAQPVLQAVLLAVLVLSLAVAAWRAWRDLRAVRSLTRFARYLQQEQHTLRQDIEIALSFEGTSQSDAVTQRLIDAHLFRTGMALRQIPPAIIEAPRDRRAERLTGFLLVAVIGAGLLDPARMGRMPETWLRWGGSDGRVDAAAGAAERFLAEFEVEITPPAYTELPPERLTGAAELIRAMRGSTVDVGLRLGESVEAARLRLPDGSVVSLQADDSKARFEGRFVVADGGPLGLEIDRREGWEVDGHERRIELIADEPPGVRLLGPEDGLVVTPAEQVTFRFEASDDFAVTGAELVVDAGAGERRFALPATDAEQYKAEKRFDVAEIARQEGVTVRYFVEVRDNDTVSGPKLGRSATQTLEIFSPRKAHRELLERQDRLFDQVVHVLGDSIALPEAMNGEVLPRLGALATRLGEARREFSALLDAFADDSLADPASLANLRDLRTRIERMHADARSFSSAVSSPSAPRKWPTYRGNGVVEAEDVTIDFADLIKRDRMNELLGATDRLRSAQEELRSMIAAYREDPTPEKLAALRRKMAEIKELMQEVARLQQDAAETLPDEFLNADAFKKAQKHNPAAQLDDLEKLLAGDDPERMLEELEKFDENLSQMLAGMDEAGQQVNQQAGEAPYQALSKALNEVSELERGQRRLAEEAASLGRKEREAAASQASEAAREVSRQLDELEAAAKEIERQGDRNPIWHRGFGYHSLQASRDVSEAREAMRRGDWERARQAVSQAESRFRTLENLARFEAEAGVGGQVASRLSQSSEQAGDKANQIRESLDSMGQAGGKPGAEARRLEQAQEKLQERLSEVQQRMQAPGEGAMVGEGVRESLEAGGSAMGEARSGLERGRVPDAAMKAEEAAEKLAAARESLEQMKQEMESRARQGGRPGSQQASSGMSDVEPREKVEIPGEGQRGGGRRDEVLKGMREGIPESYRELNKRYYDRLVR